MKRNIHKPGIRHRSHAGALTSTAAALVTVALLSVGVGPASATPSHWETYRFEYGPALSFCGPSFEEQGVDEGRERLTSRGPAGLPHYQAHGGFTTTWTNVATGEFVTQVASYRALDRQVTDNGDGTLTILIQYTVNQSLYSEAGQVLGRDTGRFSYGFLVDHAGTPTDPSDDVFLTDVGDSRRTGQNFNLCPVLDEAIG